VLRDILLHPKIFIARLKTFQKIFQETCGGEGSIEMA